MSPLQLLFLIVVSSRAVQDSTCANDEAECVASTSSSDLSGSFFVWPAKARELLTQLFPNVAKFADAWEVHPLLSKVHYLNEEYLQDGIHIPAIFHNGTSTASSWFTLLSVSDVPTILSQTINSQPLVHGTDYKMVKKVMLPSSHEHAGEEYMGMLPRQHYQIQEVLHNFHYRGFSLVIDKMQKRWRSIASKAREIEEALGVQHVGVNMYLTPEALEDEDGEGGWTAAKQVRQGFEAHWDWMDVIVVQLSGRKRWSVAKHPTIYLSNQDQKRKPSKHEAEFYFSKDGHFREFTLCPGDVLYIPRGFIHNASTVDFDELEDDPYDKCDHPSDLVLSQHLMDLVGGPSLHLTFGLEQGCEGTMEALLHHTIDAYFSSIGTSHAIVASCNATWRSILHYSLAEVARRKHQCDNALARADMECNGSALLRRSMPLFIHDNKSDDDHLISPLKANYHRVLETVSRLTDMMHTLNFVQSQVIQQSETEISVCFPDISSDDAIACVDELLSHESLQHEYVQIVQKIMSYASANFDAISQRMILHRNNLREKSHREQQAVLENVGQ